MWSYMFIPFLQQTNYNKILERQTDFFFFILILATITEKKNE